MRDFSRRLRERGTMKEEAISTGKLSSAASPKKFSRQDCLGTMSCKDKQIILK